MYVSAIKMTILTNSKVRTYSIYIDTKEIRTMIIEEHEYIDCPVEVTLNLLSSKWKALIIRKLLTGKKRFSKMKRMLHGLTQKMLTKSLRGFEVDGLIE